MTAEARTLRRVKPHFAVPSLADMAPAVRIAARGGQLPPGDLLDVLAFLRAAHQARNHLAPLGAELPGLSSLARGIAEFAPLIESLTAALGPRGEILDGASPMLPDLRRAVQITHDRLLERLNRILRNAVADGIAQETLITERDGRYVIPIKAESRGHLKGVVHDVSSSGATLFVEPLAMVELGNAWREARLAEEQEIERILRRLSAAVGEEAGHVLAALSALGEIDFALAKADLATEMDAPLPRAGGPIDWVVPAPAELRLQTARHPLLRGEVVPITVVAGGDIRGILITGPNTGGKTVAIKTAGLLAAMAQAGLGIPAEPGTQCPVYASIFADIGDEQSIEQSLSTFSSHMRNVIRILEEAGPATLVLLDELGAGTDPTEGAALGRALLGHLLDGGATVIATTHHGDLKLFAYETPGLINASVEFDSESLAPTFRLRLGLPGRSNAIAIARRLGMPESVLQQAEQNLAPRERSVEHLLADLQRERDAAADARRAEEHARREAEQIHAGLRQRMQEVEAQREQVLGRTERRMEEELTALSRAIRAAERDLARGRRETIEAARAQADQQRLRLEEVRTERLAAARQRRTPDTRPDPALLQPGDLVLLEGFDQPGEVLDPLGPDGMLTVQLGPLRARVEGDRVRQLVAGTQRRAAVHVRQSLDDPGSRLEVRGMTLDAALPDVEQFLDRAFRAGHQRLEVVHGKGTGALRQAVRDLLRQHPLVGTFEPALREEGGEGVTIVHLAR